MAGLTGLALTKAVAERLGWTDFEQHEVFCTNGVTEGFKTRLTGTKDDVAGWFVPDFAGDVSEALTLAPTKEAGVLIQRLPAVAGWHVSFVETEEAGGRSGAGRGADLATALCLAWLEWTESGETQRKADPLKLADDYFQAQAEGADVEPDPGHVIAALADEVKRLRDARDI